MTGAFSRRFTKCIYSPRVRLDRRPAPISELWRQIYIYIMLLNHGCAELLVIHDHEQQTVQCGDCGGATLFDAYRLVGLYDDRIRYSSP